MINSIQAIGALANINPAESTSATSALGASGLAGGIQPQGQSFADMLGGMATDMVDNMKSAEVASLQGIRGEANTREVIDAVMSAEQSLQTAISIRDKIVTAYLEIARMPI